MPRRPSAATVIALVALFVALGGPAEAARLIVGKDIRKNAISAKHIRSKQVQSRHVRDRTLRLQDLNAATVAELRLIADGTIGSPQVRDQSLVGADIAPNAISFDEIADNGVRATELAAGSVDSDEVIDGGLAARDVASFAGTVEHDFPAIDPGTCATQEFSGTQLRATPSRSLNDDVISVSTPSSFATSTLVVSAAATGEKTFRVRVCNVGGPDPLDPANVSFRYVSFDL